MSGQRILVTGATGVIGRRVLPLLVAAGHDMTAHVRSPERRALVEQLGARAALFDIFDAAAARAALADHHTLINLATHIPSPPYRMFLPWTWRENDRLRRAAAA